MINKKKEQSFGKTDLSKSIDEGISNFEIIRSNKNFQLSTQNSAINNNKDNLNKKKKKKRSKAVIPQ